MTREEIALATAAYLSKGGEIKQLPSVPNNPDLTSNRSILERVMAKDTDHPVRVREGAEGGYNEHAVYLPIESAFKI